jgi:TPR repeat protein
LTPPLRMKAWYIVIVWGSVPGISKGVYVLYSDRQPSIPSGSPPTPTLMEEGTAGNQLRCGPMKDRVSTKPPNETAGNVEKKKKKGRPTNPDHGEGPAKKPKAIPGPPPTQPAKKKPSKAPSDDNVYNTLNGLQGKISHVQASLNSLAVKHTEETDKLKASNTELKQRVAEMEVRCVEWYEKAAGKGDGDAMNNLGECYSHGYGVAKDEAKGVEWYEKAVETGDIKAMNNLGYCYSHGIGVVKDLKKGADLHGKAAEKGTGSAAAAVT